MCVCVCVCVCMTVTVMIRTKLILDRQLSLKDYQTEFNDKPDKRFNRLQCHRRTDKRMWSPPKVFIFTSQRIPIKKIMKGAAPIRLCEKSGSITYFTQFQNIYFLTYYIYICKTPDLTLHS
jgi:hypothetical protein